jgi:hypothetical protein
MAVDIFEHRPRFWLINAVAAEPAGTAGADAHLMMKESRRKCAGGTLANLSTVLR